MAPSGRNTTTCRLLLFLSLALLALTSLTLYLFHEELLSTLRTYTHPSCICPSPVPSPPPAFPSNDHKSSSSSSITAGAGAAASSKQATLSTTYTTLYTLEELPPANVLWVNTTNPERDGDGDGEEVKPEAWGVSMFHSFHCLKMWRDSLGGGGMGHGHEHGHDHGGEGEGEGEGMSEYAEHAGHCIDYLVSAISCFADGTIEPPEDIVRPEDGKHGHRIQGMGYAHECRDASLLWEMDGRVVEGWEWRQGDTVQSVFGGR